VCEVLRKFDVDSLYICPPYLYAVATLPWEIQKSHFSTVISYILQIVCVISEENNNCCTAICLLTVLYVLLIICVAILYGQFFNLFGQ